MNTAKMSAFALRAIMGEAFDDDAYEAARMQESSSGSTRRSVSPRSRR